MLKICGVGKCATQQDAPKNRTEAFGPPFVNMINGPMDLLAPTFALCELREEFETETV
jgi:hypothetical protein